MAAENLYFITIVPQDEICKEIEVFKLDFAENFKSKRALKVIPHITLKAPFKLASSKHIELLTWFSDLTLSNGSFQIELKNFGAFYNKYSPVVYVNPIMNLPLFILQKELIRNFKMKYPEINVLGIELKFKPHITVAYRDLEPQKFKEAWPIYHEKKYNAVVDVNNIQLMHDGIKWNVVQLFRLQLRRLKISRQIEFCGGHYSNR